METRAAGSEHDVTPSSAGPPELTFVVPCYNEETALPETARTLERKRLDLIAAGKIGEGSRIVFVDDGSQDGTWRVIEALNRENRRVSGVKLSRNVGHQNALLAGLSQVRTEICVSIDADLQDDVAAIDEMVDRYRQGYQVVYGVRRDRSSDTPFKRHAAGFFYRLLTRLGVETIENHADFRLMSFKALQALLSFREVNLYLRGLVPLVGFASTAVYYDRKSRAAGGSKYPLVKMIALAVKGVTSFSVFPLRLIAVFGLIVSVVSGGFSVWVVLDKLFGHPAQGWASTALVGFFLGGVQMLALGVVGEYVGRIYLEVKQRPRYFVEGTTPE